MKLRTLILLLVVNEIRGAVLIAPALIAALRFHHWL